MIINTNRVLLEIFTNTTIVKSKKKDSITELISILFMVGIMICCCCLSYKKSFKENERRNSNLEIQTLREINLEREKETPDIIEV